jgi:hypothetical protein
MKFILCLFLLFFVSFESQAQIPKSDYETVAASQSSQALGPRSNGTYNRGDILERLIVVPETVSAGTVTIQDGGGSAITVFKTGTLPDLKPIVIELGVMSVSGSWLVTTGANVSVIGVGRFK